MPVAASVIFLLVKQINPHQHKISSLESAVEILHAKKFMSVSIVVNTCKLNFLTLLFIYTRLLIADTDLSGCCTDNL